MTVDLELSEAAGGHVKCWQRFAEAAAACADRLDLTVYFLGPEERRITVGGNARYVVLPPRLGTRRLGFLHLGAGHTDLAHFHPRLADELDRHDVLHTTDVFALSRTAAWFARRHGRPLTASIHTDLPRFTAVYTDDIVHGLLGRGPLSEFVLDDLHVRAASVWRMKANVVAMLRRCDHVLVAHAQDARELAPLLGADRLSRLRRGIDKLRFHPGRRNRARLEARFGIPDDSVVVLFVGRLDATKNVMRAAATARRLIDEGQRLRFLAIGEGSQREEVAALLGADAVLPGSLPQRELGWIYPSADIFVFPSETEAAGNVVLEARASGLPVVVADAPGLVQYIGRPGVDGIVIDPADERAWDDAVGALTADPESRRAMGAAARRMIEESWPTWGEVLESDLLPVWRRLAAAAQPSAIAGGT